MAKKAKKTTKEKKAAKLTAKDLKLFKKMLLEKRQEIVGDVNSIENETLKKSRLDASGDLSSMPIHMADIGTDNYEQEFALELLDSERKMLQKINDALERIDEKTYGICEGTGKAIARPRLEACPWSRYCIEYARMMEKGIVSENERAGIESEQKIEEMNEFLEELEEEKG